MQLLDANSATTEFGIGYDVLDPNKSVPNTITVLELPTEIHLFRRVIPSLILRCLHRSIMKDIEKHGYTAPTSIQAQSMPVALSGRDLLGCAGTGSGKTAAFSIPMIQVAYFISMSYCESHCLAQQPLQRGDGPLALVLAPTRELAQQIEKEVDCGALKFVAFITHDLQSFGCECHFAFDGV
ncbi:dead-box atp-dependent rna helicase 24 [Nicotiana attenuata]|uniref:Dead-box atp-dependent rna helicase 24 n=1 Tax=Nicotiana attenuata TaxID=49451 RepID=A0A1J6J507_NICAT|nr:dead-box atp-dependent rna helicase 24 [Nicotiana attenuata]